MFVNDQFLNWDPENKMKVGILSARANYSLINAQHVSKNLRMLYKITNTSGLVSLLFLQDKEKGMCINSIRYVPYIIERHRAFYFGQNNKICAAGRYVNKHTTDWACT